MPVRCIFCFFFTLKKHNLGIELRQYICPWKRWTRTHFGINNISVINQMEVHLKSGIQPTFWANFVQLKMVKTWSLLCSAADGDNTPLKDHSLSSLPTYSPLNMCTFCTSRQKPSLFFPSSRKATDWTLFSRIRSVRFIHGISVVDGWAIHRKMPKCYFTP